MSSRGAVGAALIAAVLAFAAAMLQPAPAHGAFPGKDGMIAFRLIRPAATPEVPTTGGIYAIRPGWDSPRQLTDDPSDVPSSFSPSGRRLLFTRTEGDAAGIYSLRADGSQLERLTSEAAFSHAEPAFGRHGEVVFIRFVPADRPARIDYLTLAPPAGFYHLFIRRPGGDIRQLTSGQADDGAPVFTPDGQRILFIRGAGRARTAPSPRVYSIRRDGTGMRRLPGAQCGMAPSQYGGLDVSPDGQRIAFSAVEADPVPPCEAPRAGTWSEPLTGGAPTLAWPGAFVGYSPSGRSVAFSDEGIRVKRLGRPGRGRLLVRGDCPLEACKLNVFGPVWQPLP